MVLIFASRRWLRLLFTRELSMPDALTLWDGLFACDPTLDLAQWICVAMLIRIRNECELDQGICILNSLNVDGTVIHADYSSQLTTLLRYPSCPLDSRRIEGAPHHASLLVRQALALQLAPAVETGATIVMENRTLLDIPIEVPSPTVTSPRKGSSPGPPRTASSAASNGSPGRHVKHPSSSAALSDFTRGLVERGESLGINKTLMNAVSEIRVR
jgi:TBC1 domain family protein 5